LQNRLTIDLKLFIIIGLSLFFLPGLKLEAQSGGQENEGKILSVSFVKPEIAQQAGQLSFNVIRIRNLSDSACRFKPILKLPDDWLILSAPFKDTIVPPNDSIMLAFRFKLPDEVSSETKFDISFRAYSMKNKLLSESSCSVFPEPFHNWNIVFPENRIFFYPRRNLAEFELRLENNGNTEESINLLLNNDDKVEINTLGNWKAGMPVKLRPFQDSTMKFSVKYTSDEFRVFDISKLEVKATAGDELFNRSLMLEKYNDTYAPLIIDRSLPHQVEIGTRTFSGNDQVLPFIKARGLSTFKNNSTFQYNFNYYALTGNEDLISNSYYHFLYTRKGFKVGIGAFSSPLGRNLYTRNGLMLSNIMKLSKTFSMEAYLSQGILSSKTSIATGYTYEKNKVIIHGSVAYDLDYDKNMNTGSVMVQSNRIKIFRRHDISFNVYGYHEQHDLQYDYTLAGIAWDLNYFAKFGDYISIHLVNNYGSPLMPGPQMGLLNFGANGIILLNNRKNYFSVKYINSSRDYHTYSFEGEALPNAQLYDQYVNLLFNSNTNPNHIWEAGPSTESYRSYRPASTAGSATNEYFAQKLRLEYQGSIYKFMTLQIKTGFSNIHMKETTEQNFQKYDFHLLGGMSFRHGIGFSFGYDYGPLVNNGLYQFSGDVDNHSITVSPTMMGSYFNERINFNLFANFIYRFDLDYASFNLNPRIEAFIVRDWYVVASGTYHLTRQEYPDFVNQNDYTYLELSVKKRFGKSDINKWQKDTRRLRIVMFKDDNSNGVKDEGEMGLPFVKTRLKLTNSDNPNFSEQFPVDIILLSNSAGTVNYNRLPKGFYELSITPLSDVKEYFYVDKSAEKLELTRNATYYIPFQKANKISGKIEVQRAKFIKAGEEKVDLKNIRVTAYNKQGNSYSSFTLDDGSFNIFVPEDNTYYLRIGNVFGSSFKIVQNDIPINVGDGTKNEVVFNVAEVTRQVKFKDAKPAKVDTAQAEPLKIKVLHGKFYENTPEAAVDPNAVPQFNIPEAPVQETELLPGNFYVVIGTDSTRTNAVKLKRIADENGLDASLGYYGADGNYYIFTKYYQSKGEARDELARMKLAGYLEAEIIKFE
jgi:hypothetical protein